MRYFFDTRDNGVLLADTDGLEFDQLDAIETAATIGLAELARDELPKSERRRVLSIEVRDENQRPIVKASIVFEVSLLAANGWPGEITSKPAAPPER